jgi:GNAT superfamily N-acetyltransferase
MDSSYRILPADKPTDAMWTAIGGGISRFNTQHAGSHNHTDLVFMLYDPDGNIAGGLIGETYWDWLYINLLFVKEELRGSGYGHRLMQLAEEEARKRGMKHAYLDTFSFQAPEFYRAQGYRPFGQLEEFPPGYQRIFFTKDL